MYNTQLTDATNYDVNRMIFSDPQSNKLPGNDMLKYQRINIGTRNEDGSVGDLILKTSTLFSFGLQESKSMETKEVNGYVMPLCLWDKTNPSEEEKAWTETFNRICEQCKKHLVANRDSIGKWDLELNDLKKFNPLYWKRDKTTGKIDPGTGPTLYAKVISSRRDKTDRIITVFYDADTFEEIDPLTILNKYCHATSAIKIESIFIGTKISLQVKLWEVEVKLHGTKSRRLLTPSAPRPQLVNEDDPAREPIALNSNDDDIKLTDEDEYVEQAKASPPRKRVTGRRKQ